MSSLGKKSVAYSRTIAYRKFRYTDLILAIPFIILMGYRTTTCLVYNGSCSDKYSNFTPIKELAQPDADITLIFLSANGILFTDPVNDEWYAAHQASNETAQIIWDTGSFPYYLSDKPASVLGCKEQYQRCDPTVVPKQGCSPLGGAVPLEFVYQAPKGRRDMSVYWGLLLYTLQNVIENLQSSSLTARFSLNQGLQARLPANQWQREVENWHNIVLASFQGLAIESAVGPGDPEMLKNFWQKKTGDVGEYLCKNQVCKQFLLIICLLLVIFRE